MIARWKIAASHSNDFANRIDRKEIDSEMIRE